MEKIKKIDLIIPCYAKSSVIRKGLFALASSWHSEKLHVVLVDDCSPNTDCHYKDLIDEFKEYLDIEVTVNEKNTGQGLARQWGIDHTSNQYFMLQDEDDIYTPMAISQFIDILENSKAQKDQAGNVLKNEAGEIIYNPDALPVSVISGPLLQLSDNCTYTINASLSPWLNSKLYNRVFIEKHNIRFTETSSRHSEDYDFLIKLNYCVDFDNKFQAILINNSEKLYLWCDNKNSQSRSDKFYGYMLSSYTTRSSAQFLQYVKKNPFDDEHYLDYYRNKVLNVATYAYHSYMSFIDLILSGEWICTNDEWDIFREAMQYIISEYQKENNKKPYTIFEIEDESESVRHRSDAQQTYRTILFKFTDLVNNKVDYLNRNLAEIPIEVKAV